jgi:signal transduction histidine kinase
LISIIGNGRATFTNTMMESLTSGRSIETEVESMSNETEIEMKGNEDEKIRILMDLLSHDINNHIYGSMGYLELLQTMVQDNPTLARYLTNSMSELKSISHLVDNVRLLVNLSNEEFNGESVDLFQTLSMASEAAEYQIDTRKLDLSLDFKEGERIVRADRFLQDVFVQLLMNSMKYNSNSQVSVNISSEGKDGMINLVYEDNGKGISNNLKDKVFTRFDKSIQEGDVHGKGMGLSVVNSVIQRYGGIVSLEDVTNGGKVEGTRFRLSLPSWN